MIQVFGIGFDFSFLILYAAESKSRFDFTVDYCVICKIVTLFKIPKYKIRFDNSNVGRFRILFYYLAFMYAVTIS